jgi:hypothetical protein
VEGGWLCSNAFPHNLAKAILSSLFLLVAVNPLTLLHVTLSSRASEGFQQGNKLQEHRHCSFLFGGNGMYFSFVEGTSSDPGKNGKSFYFFEGIRHPALIYVNILMSTFVPGLKHATARG